MLSPLVTRRRVLAIWDASPLPTLVLSPDLQIVGANPSYAEAAVTRPSELVGRHIFDVFPDNPAVPESQNVTKLRTSFERVLRRRVPDDMPLTRYDVRDRTGAFVERHWKPSNRPILNGRSGDVEFLLHTATNETERVLRERALIEDGLQALEVDAGDRGIDEAYLADPTQVPAAPPSATLLADFDALTAREKEVAALALDGKPSKCIAFELGISARTVEVYRTQVLRKMQVNSFFELARLIWKQEPNNARHNWNLEFALRLVIAGRLRIEKAYDLIERMHVTGQKVEQAERTLKRLKRIQLEQERDLRQLLYDLSGK